MQRRSRTPALSVDGALLPTPRCSPSAGVPPRPPNDCGAFHTVPVKPLTDNARAPTDSPRGKMARGTARLPPVTPRSTGHLIGRDADLASVCQLLRSGSTRLVTLCGPAG